MKTFKELKLLGIGVCIFEFTSRSVSTFMKYFSVCLYVQYSHLRDQEGSLE